MVGETIKILKKISNFYNEKTFIYYSSNKNFNLAAIRHCMILLKKSDCKYTRMALTEKINKKFYE